VALDGPYRIWPRQSWRIRLAKVKISFGEPLYASEVAAGEADQEIVYEKMISAVKARIQFMLDQMRTAE
jgi:hypothetical protein